MKSLVISDVHGNLAALEAVLAREADSDEVIFLGDAVGAGPQPEAVMHRIAEFSTMSIMGNHDAKAIAGGHTSNGVDGRYMHWTREQLSPEMQRYIAHLEPTRVIEHQGMRMRLHHGAFPKPIGRMAATRRTGRLEKALFRGPVRRLRRHFVKSSWDSRIWPDTPDIVFEAIGDIFPEPYVLIAHSHVQFSRKVGDRVFINPGSVGQPRLGQPLATYAIIEDQSIRFEAVAYDVEATCAALDKVPLERAFIEDWQAAYRQGRLPQRYRLRDWQPLIDQGYR